MKREDIDMISRLQLWLFSYNLNDYLAFQNYMIFFHMLSHDLIMGAV